MAKRKKKTGKQRQEQLARIIYKLTRKYSPDRIQVELAKVYESYSIGSGTESEIEFWYKCSRASFNLSSGMNKWAYEMVEDDEEEGEE